MKRLLCFLIVFSLSIGAFADVVVTSHQSECLPFQDGEDDTIEYEVRGCKLLIFHNNVVINCCLEYEPEVTVQDNTILVVEVDNGPPCDCICPFDLEVGIEWLEPGTYTVTMKAFLRREPVTFTVEIPPCEFMISSPMIWSYFGTEGVKLPVYASNPEPIQAFSFGTEYPLDVASVADITIKGTITEELGAELVIANIYNGDPDATTPDERGWATLSVIMDTEEPFNRQSIPPGNEQQIATYIFDLHMPEGSIPRSISVPFVDKLGKPPVEVLYTVDGSDIYPEKHNGQIQLSMPPVFIRSDANDNGKVNISDPVFLLSFLFAGGETPPCEDAADANDDGSIDLSDVVTILHYLFGGGTVPPPSPPGPAGRDPTPDELGCERG